MNTADTREFPIKIEGDNKEMLSKILSDVSHLEGVSYIDGDICIGGKKFEGLLVLKILETMIDKGDIDIIIKSDNSGKTSYLMRLLNEYHDV